MKKISKEIIIKGLKYTIDLVLVLLFIGIIAGVFTGIDLFKEKPQSVGGTYLFNGATMSSSINNVMISLQNSNSGVSLESVKHKFNMFIFFCGIINFIAFLLVTLQLKQIFNSFSKEDYFFPSNSLRIRNIAIVIFIWVIADFLIRFIPEIILPHNIISSSIGLNSFRDGIVGAAFGINLKMIIISAIIYLLSVVFSYGNTLKEETSLTI
jgi:hypothetical protein